MTVSEPTVYIDFLCPWAYRGAMWLAEVEKAGRIRPQFRFFSLSQNHAAHEGHATPPLWEHDSTAKGLPAFLAATAARAQSPEASQPSAPAQHANDAIFGEHHVESAVDRSCSVLASSTRRALSILRWSSLRCLCLIAMFTG